MGPADAMVPALVKSPEILRFKPAEDNNPEVDGPPAGNTLEITPPGSMLRLPKLRLATLPSVVCNANKAPLMVAAPPTNRGVLGVNPIPISETAEGNARYWRLVAICAALMVA